MCASCRRPFLAVPVLLFLSASAVAAVPLADRAVPPPGAETSVVTVRTGGDRTAAQAVAPLAGVRLGLYADEASDVPVDPAWGVCVADADGDCSFVVPDTADGGANAGARFWVRQLPDGVPAGWFANPVLRTGPGSGSDSIASVYTFRTPALAAGRTYSSTDTGPDGFMISDTYGTNYTASGGVWQDSRTNPVPTVGCGLDVAVVLDLSASVGSALPQLKAATDTFADALTGTPSRMALFSFDQASPATTVDRNHPELVPVSTKAGADAFKQLYAGWTLGKGTNWDQGLAAVAAATERYQAVVVITDGNPTRFADDAQGDGSRTHFRDVENGIFSANAVKATGARIIAVGVGKGVEGVSGLNLRALSGPARYDGTNLLSADYFQTADFPSAGQDLHDLALSRCQGSISVVKQIAPADTTGEDVTGSVNAGPGWTFDATTDDPGIGGLPATATTTDDGTGSVAFRPTFTGTDSGPVTIAEVQQDGYELVTQGGRNAVCTNLNTGAPAAVTDQGAAFTVTAQSNEAISCLVHNRPARPADVTVTKTWQVDGRLLPDGQQPAGLSAALRLTGPGGADATPQPWNTARTGYRIGEQITITETATVDRPGCTLVSSRLTRLDGAPADLPLPDTEELTGEHLTAEVTNVVDCAPEPTPPPTAPEPPPIRPPGTTAGALPATGTPALPSLIGWAAAATALGGTILRLATVRRRSRR
ncbi:vWA domain-containing protein [Kitasatospora griseola]|uniref:vWA domain-containing protein n=1 Tax=Kitasatospora griseola TaxID=2064 RepID=UPI003651CF86